MKKIVTRPLPGWRVQKERMSVGIFECDSVLMPIVPHSVVVEFFQRNLPITRKKSR